MNKQTCLDCLKAEYIRLGEPFQHKVYTGKIALDEVAKIFSTTKQNPPLGALDEENPDPPTTMVPSETPKPESSCKTALMCSACFCNDRQTSGLSKA